MVSAVDAFYDSKFKDKAPAFACAVLNSWENTIKQVVEFGVHHDFFVRLRPHIGIVWQLNRKIDHTL